MTGVGANFADQLTAGMELMFKDGGDYYSVEVASILSVNELELTEPFASLADGEDEEEYLTIQSSSVQFSSPFRQATLWFLRTTVVGMSLGSNTSKCVEVIFSRLKPISSL